MPLRAKVASSVSRTAAALSRAAGRGDGSVIGGWIGLKIDPDLLAHLATGRQVALVSGTNGKTTTTKLTAAALGTLGRVATNAYGANMPTGHTSALAKAGATPFAVLEVDEHYLARVLEETSPRAVALLNLSRDQLDRAKEVAMMAQLWRTALAAHPAVHVVANADDPMVTWAAIASPEVSWFSAGQRWQDDSWVCPECGGAIVRADGDWWCTACTLRRPKPQWVVEEDGVVDPTGAWHQVRLHDLVARCARLPRPGETVSDASFQRVPGEKAPTRRSRALGSVRRCGSSARSGATRSPTRRSAGCARQVSSSPSARRTSRPAWR